jgi:hypothetical protein
MCSKIRAGPLDALFRDKHNEPLAFHHLQDRFFDVSVDWKKYCNTWLLSLGSTYRESLKMLERTNDIIFSPSLDLYYEYVYVVRYGTSVLVCHVGAVIDQICLLSTRIPPSCLRSPRKSSCSCPYRAFGSTYEVGSDSKAGKTTSGMTPCRELTPCLGRDVPRPADSFFEAHTEVNIIHVLMRPPTVIFCKEL